jgi:peptidyl-prolyl cis-trans isomerase SurA
MTMFIFRSPVLTRCLALLAVWMTFSVHAQTRTPQNITGRDYIVAVVDSSPITNHEVDVRASQLSRELTSKGQAAPSRTTLLQTTLDRLITEKALLQYAKETGVSVDDAALNQAEQSMAARNQITVEGLHKKAAAEGTSVERLRQELRDQLTLQRLSERNVPARIKVSDAEIQQLLKERATASASTDRDIELGHIFIAVSEKATDEQVAQLKAKAQSILSKLLQGEAFANVAKAYSDGPERDKGGSMGMRPTSRYPTLFIEGTKGLAVGDVSAVLRSGAGFHILKVLDHHNNTKVTVTETRARHILLRPGGKLSQTAARAQLAEYKRQIESGKADFAQLAQAHSQDASSQAGGDLGWVAPGMFVPEFEQVMNSLKEGEIADPLVSRFGVHLIQVLARRQAEVSERELRESARNNLRDKKFDETYKLWAQEIRARAYVELRDPPQ